MTAYVKLVDVRGAGYVWVNPLRVAYVKRAADDPSKCILCFSESTNDDYIAVTGDQDDIAMQLSQALNMS